MSNLEAGELPGTLSGRATSTVNTVQGCPALCRWGNEDYARSTVLRTHSYPRRHRTIDCDPSSSLGLTGAWASKMSAAACFEALPEEIARQVASVVYHEHPRSPYALMRVNKASYAAATYWWFRNVQFQLSDRKSLRYDVENFLDACRRNGGLKHTRWLEVCGSWLRHDSDEDEEEERAEAGVEDQGRPTKRPRTDRSSLLKHIYVGDTEAALRSDRLAAVYGQRLTPVSGEDLAWQPIVNLLAELANLQDLVFNTTVPFPPTLLEALNKYHPGCRLHLMHFRLPTLGEDIMNEREMALVTSTHLHTIALTWSWSKWMTAICPTRRTKHPVKRDAN